MYGIYDDIIRSAQKGLESFDETQQLLEYPEVQADKAYYLSILAKYNELRNIKDKLVTLMDTLEEVRQVEDMLADVSSQEDDEIIYGEISLLRRRASSIASSLADALGCSHLIERAYVRIKLRQGSSKIGVAWSIIVKNYLLSRGSKIEDEKIDTAKGGIY